MGAASRWVAATLLALSACSEPTDPTALRDWAATAATAVVYRPASEHFAAPHERDRPIRRAPARSTIPWGPAPAAPAPEPPPPPENRAALLAAQADAVLALQSVAAAWLQALSGLGGGTPLAPPQQPFAAEAARIARSNAAGAASVGALGAVLAEPARAEEPPAATLRRLIGQGNGPFQSVMTALRDQLALLAGSEGEEREAIILQSECQTAAARSTGARQDAQDARDALLVGQSGRGATRQAYLGIVERIMDTHRLLYIQRDALSGPETTQARRRAEIALRRAAQNLPR